MLVNSTKGVCDLGNSANMVTIVRQRDEMGPHGPHQLLTLEQTNKQKLFS